MAKTFASRAQMGWLWHNKRPIHDKKLLAAGSVNIALLPWRVASKSLGPAERKALALEHKKFKSGAMTRKQFERVFRGLTSGSRGRSRRR